MGNCAACQQKMFHFEIFGYCRNIDQKDYTGHFSGTSSRQENVDTTNLKYQTSYFEIYKSNVHSPIMHETFIEIGQVSHELCKKS